MEVNSNNYIDLLYQHAKANEAALTELVSTSINAQKLRMAVSVLEKQVLHLQEALEEHAAPLLAPSVYNTIVNQLAAIKSHSNALFQLSASADAPAEKTVENKNTFKTAEAAADEQGNEFYVKQWTVWYKLLYFMKLKDAPMSVAELTEKIIRQEGLDPESAVAKKYGLNVNVTLSLKFKAGIIGRNKERGEYRYFLIDENKDTE